MYNYKELFPDHPIWHKFKNKKIHIDHYSSVDYGAGGNFLLTQFYPDSKNHHLADANKNEFMTELYGVLDEFNHVDRVLSTSFLDDGDMYPHHLDSAMPLLENFCRKSSQSQNIVVRAHDAPYVLINALDLDINSFTYVALDYDTNWFTKCLGIIKNRQNTFTSDRFYKIDDIITYYYRAMVNNFKTDGIKHMKFEHSAFHKLAHEIHNSFSHIIDMASPIVYMYYIDELSKEQTACVDRFIEYYSSQIKMCFSNNMRVNLTNHIHNSLSSVVDIQAVSYQDLFFDLKVPQTSIWRNCDPLEISRYSHKNIELVRSISEITLPEVSDMIKNNLEKFSLRLQAADEKLGF